MYAPDGTPRVSVGDAAHGDAVVVHRQGVEVWRGGDVVAEVLPGEGAVRAGRRRLYDDDVASSHRGTHGESQSGRRVVRHGLAATVA